MNTAIPTRAEINWTLRGHALYALWLADRTRWTAEQQQFIDARVGDIFDAGYSPKCLFTNGCGGYVTTIGFKTQEGTPWARRYCVNCGVYLEAIR